MTEYKLSILVQGEDRGAAGILTHVTGGLGTLNVALGNLVADGIKAATGALIGFGKAGLDVAMDYQSSLNMFQAVSGATDAQMAAVGARAKELGADMTLPATSAGDAAKAMTELAKAGLSVDDALKASKGTLQLAAAGNLSEAKAAEIAANALNSFGLSGDKATQVADMFAAAANRSSSEVGDIADSFKMASAVFAAFQGPVVGSDKAIQDLTTSIAILSNVGIKGSDAGTSLKQMMLQLTGPSSVAKDQMKAMLFAAMGAVGGVGALDKIIGGNATARREGLAALTAANPDIAKMGDIAYDATGKMRPLQEIIKLVTLATKDMSDEQRNQALTTVFGADATRAIIALMRAGPEAFAQMEGAITKQGAAGELAAARMKGLGGAWEGFKSTLETTQLSVMEPLLPVLEEGVRGLADALAAATPGLVSFVQTSVVPAVQWMGTWIDALIRAPDKLDILKQFVVGMGQYIISWIGQSTPGLMAKLTEWGQAFVNWVTPYIPPLLAAVGSLLEQAGMWIVNVGAPWLYDRLLVWGTQLWAWIEPQIPMLLAKASELGNELLGWINRGVPILAAWLGQWAIKFIDWIGPAIGDLIVAAGKGFASFLLWIGSPNTTGDISKGLTAWTGPFVNWAATELAPALIRALVSIGQKVWGALGELWKDAFADGSRGAAIIENLKKGMSVNDAMHAAGIPGFASGGMVRRGGLAMVGERGPELLALPGGSGVIPNGATRGLLSGGAASAAGPVNINIYGATDPRETARQVRDELIKLGRRNNGLGGVFGGYA